jgi:uncharacterized phage infection (PIP) family protein YhgE
MSDFQNNVDELIQKLVDELERVVDSKIDENQLVEMIKPIKREMEQYIKREVEEYNKRIQALEEARTGFEDDLNQLRQQVAELFQAQNSVKNDSQTIVPPTSDMIGVQTKINPPIQKGQSGHDLVIENITGEEDVSEIVNNPVYQELVKYIIQKLQTKADKLKTVLEQKIPHMINSFRTESDYALRLCVVYACMYAKVIGEADRFETNLLKTWNTKPPTLKFTTKQQDKENPSILMSACPVISTISGDSLKQFCRDHADIVQEIMSSVGEHLTMGTPQSFINKMVKWANPLSDDETHSESSQEQKMVSRKTKQKRK